MSKILLTNSRMVNRTGTEVYTRDLAIGLKSLGFEVEIYARVIGELAEEVRSEGIRVVDSVDEIKNTPDLIHGQHSSCYYAMNKFPDVPVIYFCHSRFEEPISSKQIVKYVAVDYYCRELLVNDPAINGDNIQVIYNWVDTQKFKQKKKINSHPKKALIFSNSAKLDNFSMAIKQACMMADIELHAIGMGFRAPVKNPELILLDYDIVFAKAKCAIEAMACGCAVIMCDYAGLGEMVVPENFDYARKYNFGFKNLTRPHDADLILNEIKKYNAGNVRKVSNEIRNKADFKSSLKEIISLYRQILS